MKEFIIFSISIILLMAGHFFKMLRWKQFVEIYEKPGRQPLLRALTIGYIINFFLPFRLGDIVRAFLAGRKLKNGTGFTLATVVIDRYLDVLTVGFLFLMMSLTGLSVQDSEKSTLFYVVLSVILFITSLLAIWYSTYLKKAAKRFCSLFNSKIEFSILFFLWSAITSFKDIFHRLSKKRLALMTLLMWGFYLLSYYSMAVFITQLGYTASFVDVFIMLFSRNNLDMATMWVPSFWKSVGIIQLYLVLYIAIPLFILLLISFIPHSIWHKFDHLSGQFDDKITVLQLLPQVNEKERLQFLEQYFSASNRDYLQKYLEINRDIRILEDFSAGSNATTLLCMDEQNTFYRKYAFGKDGDKLYEQLVWLHEHEGTLALPKILKEQRSKEFCCYDMPYDSAAVGLFRLIHSEGQDRVWEILKKALEDLSTHLHVQKVRPAPEQTVEDYIMQKVWGNLEKIETARELRPLLEYETLIINGKEYKNISSLKRYLAPDNLREIFKDDICTEIHGDLTVENIICWEGDIQPPYYFIDPNTGNLHDSPALDYAKLLQSLHGGYEFLMHTPNVSVEKNHISFLFTRSQSYYDIFCRYHSYLQTKFSWEQVRSIFFHEVVHWLRLMPYKIEMNGKRAVLFYAGLIMVLNDVIDWYT